MTGAKGDTGGTKVAGCRKADLRNRLSSPYLPPPTEAPTARIKIARLKYPGNWDPEPAAWTRFGRYLQKQTGVAADIQHPGLLSRKVAFGTANMVLGPTMTQAHML